MCFFVVTIACSLLPDYVQPQELITPIPVSIPFDKRKALLGRKLFSDTILSKDNTLSCSSCHDLENGGDDGRRFSVGIKGKQGNINAPTVFNAVFNFAQFWDGRAGDLKEQAKAPITNPIEMASLFEDVISKLNKNPYYKSEFNKIYRDGVTEDNIVDAIAEFEKTLITPYSKFDNFLRGETVLSPAEADGYREFQSKGCIACHNGVNIGGNMYQKFGVIEKHRGKDHLGRYNVTKKEKDKFFFKVPTLRNIALTSPYFHDGDVLDLTEAVKVMAKYQLGRKLKEEEVASIVAFLKTLTGHPAEILIK